ncbi:sugar ABC transporter ATP-binding protein [Spirochaetia bacterium]|nr:sugar ABC transporter ATP-binding protein [Spirochaetia bacterium]
MSSITLKRITKNYKKVRAVDDISLEVRDNEFFVIFGPAGAGKTSILNVIAGIIEPDQGVVLFDDEDITLVESADRNVSMVFENYALYPHMSAYDNIASPLRSPKYKKNEDEIKKEVYRVASMLHITELLDRLPSQVSNGQRQRIALGRSLVRSPRVFLMDEPLAHLDAKLRHAMRKELKLIQENFKSTTIYVTHDYSEAMSLGNRIAVIDKGTIQQVGTPNEIFYTPANRFVARLFGEPEINIIPVEIENSAQGSFVKLPWQGKSLPVNALVGEKLKEAGLLDAGLRGMDIQYSLKPLADSIRGTVYNIEPMGNQNCITVKIDDAQLQFMLPAELKPDLDSEIFLTFNMSNAIYFARADGRYLFRLGEDELGRGETIG